MAIIGLRDIIPSIDLFPVKKVFCKFDISGDTKEPVVTNKHAVIGGASNILEVISLEIDVPLDLEYAPVLTVYAYDHVMGFFGTRLLGVANIPLEKYCAKVLKKLQKAANAFGGAGGNAGPNQPLQLNDIRLKTKALKAQKSDAALSSMNVIDTEGKSKPASRKDLNADLFESLPTNLKLPELDKKSGKSAISMRKS